jgi:hypothetical protein
MENDFELPPNTTPEQREAFEKCKAAVEAHIARADGKPLSQETAESENQMRKEIDAIAKASQGTIGTFGR